MTTKHTPGPWTPSDDTPIVIRANGKLVAKALAHQDLTYEEYQANANLIAAAPDLLEALEALLDLPEFDGSPGPSVIRRKAKRAARAAIKKAKGDKP